MKKSIAILLILSSLCASADSLELCNKALKSCDSEIETLKKLRSNDQEMTQILQEQRDRAVKNQGPSLGDKVEYGVIGGAAALVIYFLIHSNK